MKNEIVDTLIIGSGPAGLTAAIYNVRADLKTLVLAGNQPGGQLTQTTTVDNWPGFARGIGGVKLMMDMQAQVRNLGVEIRNGLVEKINKEGEIFRTILQDGSIIDSKAVLITTGARAKWLGLESEQRLMGKGVSGCATCDGMFFRDKTVVVVGGGDTACEDAVFLARFASKVYLVHRRDALRASAIEQKKVFENEKIELVWNSEVKEIVGEEKVEKVKIFNNKTNEEKEIVTDGVFMAIGHNPATDFVTDMVELDEDRHIVVGKNEKYPTMTSVEGIFAAGDCTTANKDYKQAISAAGDGCKAGLDAEKWIRE